jgi:hypothetical protein
MVRSDGGGHQSQVAVAVVARKIGAGRKRRTTVESTLFQDPGDDGHGRNCKCSSRKKIYNTAIKTKILQLKLYAKQR